MLPRLILPALVALLVAACTPLMSPYSETSYRNATTLKAASAALMAKSTEPHARHADRAEALAVELDAAFEYARGLPRNTLAAEQWREMRDPNGALLGEALVRWRENGRLDPFFAGEKAAQIAEGFDLIICLEINKRDAQTC